MRVMRVAGGTLDEVPWYVDDAERLVQIAARRGVLIGVRDAHQAWESYSASRSAGWMILYEDDEETWQRLLSFLEDA